MPADPYIDPVTGILRNNLGLGTTVYLRTTWTCTIPADPYGG